MYFYIEMSLLKFVNIPIFIVSFFFGMFFMRFSSEDKQRISVYPTPDNCGKIEYVDKSGSCFEFEAIEVNCPSSPDKIKEIPVQV
jgi:hypothetical protein